MSIRPGEIYLADAGNDLHRRVLIVSREDLNQGRYVVAIPFTSTNFEKRSKLPNCVPFKAGQFGLIKDCVAQAEAITFIESAALDHETGPIGLLDDENMRAVIKAVGHMLCSDCEPC
jgi:mRNA-degrading endonuclease toxin of MazEF toxin-antitoxin module